MSGTIAAVLAATLGAGMLMSSGAEARPDVAGFRGDDSRRTTAAKTDERRLDLAFNQGPGGDGAARRRAGKRRNPALSAPAVVTQGTPSTELKFGAFPFDPMIPQR